MRARRGSTRHEGGQPPGVRPQRAVAAVLLGLALVAGVIALVGHVTEYSKLEAALDQVSAAWFPLAGAGVIVAYAGYIAAYRELAAVDGGPRLGAWTVTRVVGIGFGAFVVGSAAGGLAVDYWALRRAGCSPHEALRRVLGLNTLQWAALGGLAALAGVAALTGLASSVPLALALAWVVVVPLCFAAGGWVSAPARIERFGTPPLAPAPRSWSPGPLARWAWTGLRSALADAIGGLRYVRAVLGRPWRYPTGFAGYPLYWAGQLAALYACVRAVGENVGVSGLILAYATGYVATALPLPVGGAGGVDASLALVLTLVGLPLAPALLAAVLYRGFAFWLPILPAAALLTQLPHLTRDLRDLADRRARGGAGRRDRPSGPPLATPRLGG